MKWLAIIWENNGARIYELTEKFIENNLLEPEWWEGCYWHKEYESFDEAKNCQERKNKLKEMREEQEENARMMSYDYEE